MTLHSMARMALLNTFWADQVLKRLCNRQTWWAPHHPCTADRLGIAKCLQHSCTPKTALAVATLLGKERAVAAFLGKENCSSRPPLGRFVSMEGGVLTTELFFGGLTDASSLGARADGKDSAPEAGPPANPVYPASFLQALESNQQDRLRQVMRVLQACCVRLRPAEVVEALGIVIASGVIGLGYRGRLRELNGLALEGDGPRCFAEVVGGVVSSCAARHEWQGPEGVELLAELFCTLSTAELTSGSQGAGGQPTWAAFLSADFASHTYLYLESPRRTALCELRRRQVAHPAWDMRRIVDGLPLSDEDRADFLLVATCGLFTESTLDKWSVMGGGGPQLDLATFASYAIHFFASAHVSASGSDGCCALLSANGAQQLARALASSRASIETVIAVLLAVGEAESAASRLLGGAEVLRAVETRRARMFARTGSTRGTGGELLGSTGAAAAAIAEGAGLVDAGMGGAPAGDGEVHGEEPLLETPASFAREWAAAANFPRGWSDGDVGKLHRVLTDEGVGQQLVDKWLCPALAAARGAPSARELQWPLRGLVAEWAHEWHSVAPCPWPIASAIAA